MAIANDKIKIGEKSYNRSDLSNNAKNILKNMKLLTAAADEKTNLIRVLTKARQAYIDDLKCEILTNKAGLNFSE
jgi:hypothetical protein